MKHKGYNKINKINGFFRWTNLYDLDDHFLIEKVSGYSAEYRRFFYDDIISIMTYIDPAWKISIFLHIILAAISLFIIYTLHSPENIHLVVLTMSVFSPVWVLLLIDIIFGPTSKAQIRTVTSTENIILAKRYRKAKKILRKIQNIIEARQGAIDTDSLEEKPLQYQGSVFTNASATRVHEKTAQLPTYKYNPLYTLFLILLFSKVIISSFQMRIQGNIAVYLSSFSILFIIVNIIVLFKQSGLYIRKPLQILSWTSLIVFLSSILAAFFLIIFAIFDYGLMSEAQYISISYTDHRFMIMRMTYLIIEALLVIFGAIMSLKGHHSVYASS